MENVIFLYIETFVYTGCGDPYKGNGLWNMEAVLPVIPASIEDSDTRHRQCAQWGCFEGAVGSKYKFN